MYLWKYWRESRIFFGAVMVGIALLLWLVLGTAHAELVVNGRGLSLAQLPTILVVALFVQAVPVTFVAWIFGSFGLGRDLGERSGSYLFSRPGSRASFVWRDWGMGMAQLFLIVAFLNLVIGLVFHSLIVAAGDPLHGSILLGNRAVSLPVIVLLNFAAGFLLAGLVFSVTYFSTVLVRHSKGVMLGAGFLLGYLVLKVVVQHYWPDIQLPGLMLDAFSMGGQAGSGITENVGLAMALRTAVVLLFPLAAQFLLEKRDID